MKVAMDTERLERSEQKIEHTARLDVDLAIAGALGAVVLAVSVYFAPRGFHLGFVDMGHDGYQLRQVLDLSEGAVIFRDTFDQYGPLTGYLNTAGFLALGRRLLAVKYFLAGWYAVIGGLLFMMARRWLSRSLAAFSVILWLGLAPFYQHGIMISAHVYVLLFQTVAALIALRAVHLEPLPYAIVGVLAGLCAASKMSMGVAFLAAILLYLFLRVLVERGAWRPAAKAAVAVSFGFAIVIGIALAWLWATGALRDWYLQTVVFPRDFYLDYGQPHPLQDPGFIVRLSPRMVANFVQVQSEQALYWWVIRLVVVVTACLQLIRRRADTGLLLMACITAVLWLGVFASLNFMHQWWTVGLGIAPFVVCARSAMKRLVSGDRARSLSTVAVVLIVFGAGLIDRKNAAIARANTLTQTIRQPLVFRGIRTDATTKRAFETLYDVITRYRSNHPGIKLVTIDASDGWWTGINESLPFLSFFDGNSHSQAAYWGLPVLTTTIYSGYRDALWDEIGTQHPLIVEQHDGWYKPQRIAGYSVLAAAQNEWGNWYLYAPDHPDRAQHGEVSIYVASDGKSESGFAERGDVPKLAMRLRSDVQAALRGRLAPAVKSDDALEITGTFPFVLRDPALVAVPDKFDVYTWPTNLRTASLDGAFEPIAAAPLSRADIVRELRAGAWTVDGYAPGPYSYLLEFSETPIAAGAYLVLRGELHEGGFTVGLLQQEKWTNYVNVTQPGVFEVVVQMQKSGRYSLVVANCIETGWWQTGWRYRLRRTLRLAKTIGPNRFRVTAAGWIH
jgi:hypothetical protein